MSSSTEIGHASVVLSANADGIASGFQEAEGRTVSFAEKLKSKLMGSGIGKALFGVPEYDAASGEYLGKVGGLGNKAKSLIKGLGFAAVGLGVAGAVADGIMKGFEVLAGIPDIIRGLAETATGPEAGPLQGIVAAMDGIGDSVKHLGDVFFAALGPAVLAVRDVVGELTDRFDGLIGQVGGGLSAAFTVGVEIAGELLYAVGELIESFASWATGLVGVEASAAGMSTVVLSVFRAIGKAAAYVWDTLKAGAGAIAWVAGKIIEGLGYVLESFRGVIDLAKQLPESIRPDWIDDLASGFERTGQTIRRAGEGLSSWGADAVMGFGNSARQVDAWMDGVERRVERRRSELASTVAAFEPKLAGALQRNSKEAYSVVTKFNANAMVGASDPVAQMKRGQDETNRLLGNIERSLYGSGVLRTI